MSREPLDAAEDTAWDAIVSAHRYGNFLQTAAWAALRASRDWRVVRVELNGNAVQILVRRTPLGDFGYAPRGPLIDPEDEAGCFALRDRAKQSLGRRAIAVRYEPPWMDGQAQRAQLDRWGWRAADPVQPPSTLVIDLAPTAEALLAQMKQKWRYNIRVAERHEVRVRLGGEADLAAFERLLAETAARDGFHGRRDGYYSSVWRAFGPAAHLFVAEQGPRLLGAILVLFVANTATYLYGASSGEGRALMPNHLLQWHAIRAAKATGLRAYDFWGIPDELGRAVVAGQSVDAVPPGQGGLWGVWGFKRGFGGEVVRYAGAWDEVYDSRRYRLARWLEAARTSQRP